MSTTRRTCPASPRLKTAHPLTLTLAVTAALLVMASTGCNRERQVAAPPEEAAAATDVSASPSDEDVTTWPVPEIVIDDHGAEPRTLLQYTWPDLSPVTVRLSITTDMSMVVDGAPVPQLGQLPTLHMTMSYSELAPVDGGTRVTVRLLETTAEADPADPVSAAMAPMLNERFDGFRYAVTMTVGPDGVARDVSVVSDDVGGDMEQFIENLNRSVQQFVVPLPTVPVGPGARWTVVTPVTQGMVLAAQSRNRYVLDQLEDGTMTLVFDGTVVAEPDQPLLDPATGDSIGAVLSSLDGVVNGRMVVNLAHPLTATMSGNMSMTMTMQSDGTNPGPDAFTVTTTAGVEVRVVD